MNRININDINLPNLINPKIVSDIETTIMPYCPPFKKIEEDPEEAKSVFQKLVDWVTITPTKQLVLGASSGWISGFLAIKIGRSAAFALGGGIILLQLAGGRGYISINWDKVNEDIGAAEKNINGCHSSYISSISKFLEEKTHLSSGFIGGFLIGMASH